MESPPSTSSQKKTRPHSTEGGGLSSSPNLQSSTIQANICLFPSLFSFFCCSGLSFISSWHCLCIHLFMIICLCIQRVWSFSSSIILKSPKRDVFPSVYKRLKSGGDVPKVNDGSREVILSDVCVHVCVTWYSRKKKKDTNFTTAQPETKIYMNIYTLTL